MITSHGRHIAGGSAQGELRQQCGAVPRADRLDGAVLLHRDGDLCGSNIRPKFWGIQQPGPTSCSPMTTQAMDRLAGMWMWGRLNGRVYARSRDSLDQGLSLSDGRRLET